MSGREGSVTGQAADVEQVRVGLERDGFFVFRDVVSKERLAEFAAHLVAEYDKATSDGALFEGGGLLSGHINCYPGEASRFVWDDLVAGGIVDTVRELRPDLVDKPRATLNFNLPGSVAQHYHMDGVYLNDFLIANVAVVDTNLENGALDVLPGTNQEFLKFWRYAVERTYRTTTRVPLNQGDVILRTSTLWHRGMPNRTDEPRPMMAITFGEVDDPEADPFSLHDGRLVFYPNWFAPTWRGRLREKTFVKAPITYSTYRFVRSLRGNRGYASF